jgi:probable phosphoglycerate mutase
MPIYLIRHGETASNAARIVQTPGTPLSPRGREQARRLAQRLRSSNASLLLSSDHRRALETAEAIRTELPRAELRIEPLLQERNYGDIRGRAYSEIGVDILGPDYEPPGGETWSDFHARVATLWPLITGAAQEIEGDLIVITHGLVCHVLATRHLRLAAGLTVPAHWRNTAVTILDGEPPWTVRTINCTAHLDAGTGDDTRGRSGL